MIKLDWKVFIGFSDMDIIGYVNKNSFSRRVSIEILLEWIEKLVCVEKSK